MTQHPHACSCARERVHTTRTRTRRRTIIMCTRCNLQCKRESISEWQFARYIIQSASAIYDSYSRFSRRNNADISTLASPALL